MLRITEWLNDPAFQNARFTSIFRQQLHTITLQRALNPFTILDEIRALEGDGRRQSRTKASSSFKGGLLHGLMHKHYFSARHIAKNLRNYWKQDEDKALAAIKKVILTQRTDDLLQLSGAIAHRYVDEAYKHKNMARSLTGDWIIYKRHNHHNYYLCLAWHEESEEEIYDRIAGCTEAEFPELGILARCAQQTVQSDGPAGDGAER